MSHRSPSLKIIGSQTDHIVEVDLAGASPAVHRLPGAKWLREDVPATRSDCKDGPRPCPHYRCEHHLWVVAAADNGDGRTWPGRKSTLEARTMTTCELDVLDRAERSTRTIAAVYAISQRRAQQLVKRALRKLRDAGVEASTLVQMMR